jgi:hypothetical protein
MENQRQVCEPGDDREHDDHGKDRDEKPEIVETAAMAAFPGQSGSSRSSGGRSSEFTDKSPSIVNPIAVAES